jgi:hypothetical protein
MPLGVITLGPRETDNINQMKTIIRYFYVVIYLNADQMEHMKSERNKRLITLIMITLSGFHYVACENIYCLFIST